MDLIVERELLLADYGTETTKFNKILKQPIAFQIFEHFFVDDEEKNLYVDQESPATGLYYMFKRSPPTVDANILMSFPTNQKEGVVFMYLFFYDTKMDENGFVCAPVKNNLEYGSKHLTLVAKVMEVFKDRRVDLIFVQAGEMMFNESGICVFNHFSGTYTKTRMNDMDGIVDDYADFELEKQKADAIKNTLYDWAFTKFLFISKSPMTQFEFSSLPFVKKYLPLVSTLKFLPSEEYFPYVIPNNTNGAFMFEKAVKIISTFINLKEMKAMSVNVTTLASDQIDTTSISMKQIDENSGPTVPTRIFTNRVTVLPYKDDLKLALGVLRNLGAKKLNYGMKYKANGDDKCFDLFNLEGKTFNVNKMGQLKVIKFLSSSNDFVYLCKIKDTDVVLKVVSLYPFSPKNGGKYVYRNILREEKFYGTEIHSFIIPGHAGLGTVYPYLGKTITSLSKEERKRLYPKFKEQYTKLWLSKTLKQIKFKNMPRVSFYNDMKPENTTIDKDGNFHLIDLDEFAYTPQYYGPTTERIFFNQMFGILMVIYWFKTGESPFKLNWTSAQKLAWVNEELKDHPDIKEMFNILMDPDLTDDQKIIMFN